MRSVILNLAVTLDGYIAGPHGEYDWCFTDEDYGLTAFQRRIDTLIMGRKTFEVLLPFGRPYPGKMNYVFSQTLKGSSYDNVEIINDDPVAFTRDLKQKAGRDIWLYGGAALIAPLRDHGLIDEMHLSVHPLLLGDGVPLFGKGARTGLRLADCRKYASGLVQLIYRKT